MGLYFDLVSGGRRCVTVSVRRLSPGSSTCLYEFVRLGEKPVRGDFECETADEVALAATALSHILRVENNAANERR